MGHALILEPIRKKRGCSGDQRLRLLRLLLRLKLLLLFCEGQLQRCLGLLWFQFPSSAAVAVLAAAFPS